MEESIKGILEANEYYIDGARKSDRSIVAKAFADDATMSWSENGELRIVPIGFCMIKEEKECIIRALEHTNGNKILAAKLLGIGRTTLYTKMEKYEITIKKTILTFLSNLL